MVGSFEYYVFDYAAVGAFDFCVVGAFDFCVVGAFDYSVVGALVYGVLTVVVAMGLADQPEKTSLKKICILKARSIKFQSPIKVNTLFTLNTSLEYLRILIADKLLHCIPRP